MDLKSLNDKQKEAVLATEGALLILAGAGSGKTRVLTTKIAYLIEEKNIYPSNIVAITFTNKAAKEMKERVAKLIDEDVDRMWIGTFHSICGRILRMNIDKLGYTNSFTIYDRDDQKSLIKEIMKERNISEEQVKIPSVIATISDQKNKGISPEEFQAQSKQFWVNQRTGEIYEAYEKKKKEYNSLDFDDLILKTLELFSKCPDIRDFYAEKFRYVFVDEYQDTNKSQYELIRYFSEKHKNISVVGDGDQSIYGWRGADISNILNFEKDFREARTVLLEENYRSTKNILDAANVLIKNNEERKEKNLWTGKEAGRSVEYRELSDEYGESRTVTELINNCQYDGYRLNDMAILYRTNAQSREFEEALMRESIPYRVIGGLKFYDRREIKDVLAYLKVLVNPDDNISFKRIINTPKRGIGNTTIEKLENIGRLHGDSIYRTLLEPKNLEMITKKTRSQLQSFLQLIEHIQKRREDLSLMELTEEILEKSGYIGSLQSGETVEDRARLENLESFVSSIAAIESSTPEITLEEYLQSVSLMSDVDKSREEKSGVDLMTIHSSKGLEYKVVFLTGMEEGLFPSGRSKEEGNLEEERRLCYVAITRAEERLYLTGTSLRRTYGKLNRTIRSRFIDELEGSIDIISEKIRPKLNGEPAVDIEVDGMRESIRQSVLERKKSYEEKLHLDLKLGDKVRHKTWGEGRIVSVTPREGGDELVIAFDRKGLKKLNKNIAPIERIDP